MWPHVKVYLLDFISDIRFRYLFRLNRTFSDTSPRLQNINNHIISLFTNYGAGCSTMQLLVWNPRPFVWSVLNHMSKFQNFAKYGGARHNIQRHETCAQTFQTCTRVLESQSHTWTCPNLPRYNFSYNFCLETSEFPYSILCVYFYFCTRK